MVFMRPFAGASEQVRQTRCHSDMCFPVMRVSRTHIPWDACFPAHISLGMCVSHQ